MKTAYLILSINNIQVRIGSFKIKGIYKANSIRAKIFCTTVMLEFFLGNMNDLIPKMKRHLMAKTNDSEQATRLEP